ncbi:hypothetical protein CGZ93_10690 [Enemella dayhoffiae]|uniref:Peptidase C51 domain-containing protein n=1 Tax=Enemella dayhoffiae TaxID=2016507 RepID=A0A255H3V6_9ACTN|nr:hypothetical protein CGZ93_10690 [Enemella dayhoffiae]
MGTRATGLSHICRGLRSGRRWLRPALRRRQRLCLQGRDVRGLGGHRRPVCQPGLGERPAGLSRSAEICGLRDGGCVQLFSGGNVYYTRATGPVQVWGAIRDRYDNSGLESGRLGYPTEPEFCGLRDGGCVQRYQGGLIYFTPRFGAHAVLGAIVGSYSALDFENGKLGYPIGEEYCDLANRGCAQNFATGLIQFSPATGAHPIWGEILRGYGVQGWERGPLGYPTSAEFCNLRDNGCAQRFQNGLIYFTTGTGPQPVRGAILARYAALGHETGTLGYPKGPESAPSGGRISQAFQGGTLVFDQATGRVTGPGAETGGGIPLVPGAYPDANAPACGFLWCKNGSVYSERGFAYRNCTDFAAFRRGMVWSQINGSGDGNARGWKNGWIQRGRTVSSTPKVGAVAWWAASSTSSGYGHVAIVIGVNSDGSAKVEEYNYATPGGYGIRNSVRADAYLY